MGNVLYKCLVLVNLWHSQVIRIEAVSHCPLMHKFFLILVALCTWKCCVRAHLIAGALWVSALASAENCLGKRPQRSCCFVPTSTSENHIPLLRGRSLTDNQERKLEVLLPLASKKHNYFCSRATLKSHCCHMPRALRDGPYNATAIRSA